MNRSKAIYQLFRPAVFRQQLHVSLTGKGRNKLSLTHTLTQCDKFPSVTHKAVLAAIVRGSADQTLHGALLQIQASTRAALLCSAAPGGQQAGYCHKGNHAVIHVSVPLHDSIYEVVKVGLAHWFLVA